MGRDNRIPLSAPGRIINLSAISGVDPQREIIPRWDAIKPVDCNGKQPCYYSLTWHDNISGRSGRAPQLTSNNHTLLGLKPGAIVTISVKAVSSDSREGQEVNAQWRLLQAPSKNVNFTRAVSPSSSDILVEWLDVPIYFFNGIKIGYNVSWFPLSSPSDFNSSLVRGRALLQARLTGIWPMTSYSISVAAVSSDGTGPATTVVRSTRPAPLLQVTIRSQHRQITVTFPSISPNVTENCVNVTGVALATQPWASSTSRSICSASKNEVVVKNLEEFTSYQVVAEQRPVDQSRKNSAFARVSAAENVTTLSAATLSSLPVGQVSKVTNGSHGQKIPDRPTPIEPSNHTRIWSSSEVQVTSLPVDEVTEHHMVSQSHIVQILFNLLTRLRFGRILKLGVYLHIMLLLKLGYWR